jgi:hypothetical protein
VIGQVIAGRYEIVKHQARQLSMDRMVALELMYPR